MKKYQCHKVVEAAKIEGINERMLTYKDGHFEAAPGWMAKHNPQVGGYLVRYEDGYLSYSPAKAFEDGYKPLNETRSPPVSEARPAGGD